MSMRANPFLHHGPSRIYNPLTDRTLAAGDGQYEAFRAFVAGGKACDALVRDGWLTDDGDDLSRRHHLKIVSIETLTTCNQPRYFCPVFIAPRDNEAMPDAMFDSIVAQLGPFRSEERRVGKECRSR